MADKKRYQIFVSSTFADLEVERGKVMETILSYDCFPAGMEMFPAMDEEQFKYIKRIIDDSDYYLLIIGGRYGSVDESGVSWTEKEYDYAVSKGIPVLVFDHKDFTQLPANKTDQNDKKRKKLIVFKQKVSTGRLIKYWTNVDDLDAVVAKSLPRVLELQPRTGWVRADSMPRGEAQKEIDRLITDINNRSTEIKRLQISLEELKTDLKGKDKDLKSKEAELKKKDTENKAFESKYQAAQMEIENLNEQIKSLYDEMEKYKNPSPTNVKELQPQTELFTVRGVEFKMVHVEGGAFMMGANEADEDASAIEKPSHEVKLSDYWIGETLVTQALWEAVMGVNPSDFKGEPNLPVERVSWEDCQEFIQKLNKLTGRKFCLPTEEQWEFAARGGNKSKGFKFAGSNDINDVAWYKGNSQFRIHPVGELNPNELGLYDMTGNVWEWCDDKFYDYSSKIQSNPTGPIGSNHVYRGGGWLAYERYCRVSYRYYLAPQQKLNDLGLRLAL